MLPRAATPRAVQDRELERLYYRRSAIDKLMQSLEEYDRCRPRAAAGSLDTPAHVGAAGARAGG